MSSPITPSLLISPDTCYHRCSCDRQNPMSGGYYVVTPAPSPTLTTVAMLPRNSPTFTISPLPATTQLPTLAVLNTQNTHHRCRSPSPVQPTLVLTTPNINPLVAHGSDPHHDKVHYDVSKGLSDIRVSKLRGPKIPISDEQKQSLVVEGVSRGTFHVVFDHPGLTSTIEFKGTLTVGDFLEELHSHMDERVGDVEMFNLKKDSHCYQTAGETQVKRCQAAFNRDAEWDRGMKRVDILGKKCKFHGIYLDTSRAGNHLTLGVVFGR